MKKYTLGFIFNASLDKVLLMHKLKPDWQVGKLNGLGGKMEDEEDGIRGIQREIKEEAGLNTEPSDWIYIGTLHSATWTMEVFGYIYTGDLTDAKSLEEERVEWFDVEKLPKNVINNLRWLIPMTLDKLKHGGFKEAVVEC
ncbi:MAG: NUDIX domain-containing protein [Candidatus Uhrbacteria bacterium]|nr:NUDIX domain-containing protein [Candidatus Uhrbacteria bacterium]